MIELQSALIRGGQALESMGQLEAALKIAEATLLMCDIFTPEDEDEVNTLAKIRILLPAVAKRIRARIADEGGV